MPAEQTPLLVIRGEEPADRERVFEVNAQAFETELEAKLVEALRGSVEPLISLVASVEERVVGHILFTPVTAGPVRQESALMMALGPMAVLPDFQNRGIGSRLVEEGLARCRALGAAAVFVLGHAEYYPRFGFAPAAPHGLHYRSRELDPYFMVLELQPGTLESLSGFVHFRPEFEGT